MPNISGIITNGTRLKNPDEILKKFKVVHAINGLSYIQKELKTQTCVICNTLTGILKATLEQPAIDPKGNTFLFLEGEIYNSKEVRAYLNISNEMSLCDLLLFLFMKKGTEFVKYLNGEFNIVIYQKREQKLIIFTDHLSSKPFYYLEQRNSLLFGSEKKSILATTEKSPTIDPVGLLQMFVHGHNLDGRTFIKDLKCIPPASYLEYCQGQLIFKRYSSLIRFSAPKSLPSLDSLIEQWCEEIKRATSRRLEDKRRILLNLSGGYDSRVIACAIPRNFRPIFSRTRGKRESQELIYAAKIARRLGFKHFREEPSVKSLSELLYKIVWRTECEVNFIGCLSIDNHSIMKKHGDFLMGGVLGGIIKGYNYPRLFLPYCRRKFIESVYQWHLKKSEGYLKEIFNHEFISQHLAKLKNAFLKSFASLESDTNKQLYEIWSLYEYQIRGQVRTGAVDNYLFEHIRPLLDREHLEFVLKLPDWLRFGQVLYQAMIHKLGPEIRDIPIANTNLRVRNSVFKNYINTIISLGKKSYIKVFRKFGKHSKIEYKPSGDPNRPLLVRNETNLKHIIKHFVQSNSFDDSILNKRGVLKVVDRYYRGIDNNPQIICLLATFAIGIPYFITSSPTSCPTEAEPLFRN